MNEVSLKFATYSPPRLGVFTLGVTTALGSEKGLSYFPITEPPLADIIDLDTRLKNALGEETATSVAALRASLFDDLVKELKKLAGFLELKADGDLVKLAATGFDLKKTTRTRHTGPAPTPQNARAKHGISRQIILSVDPIEGVLIYQGAWSHSAEGPFTSIDGVSNSQKIIFNNLERGKDTYFMVRATGRGEPGDWSDIVKIMVI